MGKGLDEQHLTQTMVCGGSFHVSKPLGEAPEPAKPSLQQESVGQRVKSLLCFLSHLGHKGHTQHWGLMASSVLVYLGSPHFQRPGAQRFLQLSESPWTSPRWGKPVP